MSMQNIIESEFSEVKSAKPVKRVRFSDEIKNVYEFERLDDRGIISLENENNSVSVNPVIPLQNMLCTDESAEINEVLCNETVPNNIGSQSESCSHLDEELVLCNEIANESAETLCDDIQLKDESDSSAFVFVPSHVCSSDSDINVNGLIDETRLMTISPNRLDEVNESALIGKPHPNSPNDSPNEKNLVQGTQQPIVQNNVVLNLSRKRSLEGMFIEKQTSKLNSCLWKNNSTISSADELRNAVFSAWSKVKSEKTSVQSRELAPDVKKNIDESSKTKSINTYEAWKKRSMIKAKKMSCKVLEPTSQKTIEDLEESKMAFRAWKRKKDELIRQQIAEKYRKEEKESLDSLMNERMRKKDAESAYLAWNAHKAIIAKMERKREKWLLEKEKEKRIEKIERDSEALKMYYEWLRKKVQYPKNRCHKNIEDKPPWTPPGKADHFS